jgi:hypothetical protein
LIKRSKKVALAVMFGAIIFASKIIIILPTPMDKMFLVIQALLLALGSLLLGKTGATYVASIDGLLVSAWRIAYAPFSFIFALVYGVLVDASFYLFKVKPHQENIKTSGLVASLALSTAIVGLLSMYVTVLTGLMPMVPILYLGIIIVGIANGTAAGYLASFLWRKVLHNMFRSLS